MQRGRARHPHLVRASRLGAFGTLAVVLAVGACAAPTSFDGLVNGAKEDELVQPPRPISPISVSTVATSHPRFRWDLPDGETGAVVELSRTRDFGGTTKTFSATGSELVVPEDIEPGIWFWRLRGSAPGKVGTLPSVTWEVLVRGPAAHGASDVAMGSVFDLDGDGEPDLLASIESAVTGSGKGATDDTFILAFRGERGGWLADQARDSNVLGTFGSVPPTEPMSIGAGTDVDGDGYSDIIHSGLGIESSGGGQVYSLDIEYGSATGFDIAKARAIISPVGGPVIATVRDAVDVNGDGYGDVVIADDYAGVVNFGGPKGPTAYVGVFPTAPPEFGFPYASVAGFDADGDGFGDLLLAHNRPLVMADTSDAGEPLQDAPSESTPAYAMAGDALMSLDRWKNLDLSVLGDVPTRVLATADFNGDGLSDLAIAAPTGNGGRVCVWFGDRERFFSNGPCVEATEAETSFGAAITAGDIEGDGQDDLVISAKNGEVTVMRVIQVSEGSLAVKPFGSPGAGSRLTTIWPGRPGHARIAALTDDALAIDVYEGASLKQSVHRPPQTRAFGRGLR